MINQVMIYNSSIMGDKQGTWYTELRPLKSNHQHTRSWRSLQAAYQYADKLHPPSIVLWTREGLIEVPDEDFLVYAKLRYQL